MNRWAESYQSRPGGVNSIVTMPLASRHSERYGKLQLPRAYPSPGTRATPIKVLIVEDNPDIVELELRRGKQHFPRFNAVRLWLSWAAWVRDRKSFGQSFETALTIADRLGIAVVPCLFNRWHNEFDDNGGIYIDHFMPGWSWLSRDEWRNFRDYLEMIVGAHTDDKRVLCWDMCNEPFSYTKPVSEMREIEQAEYNWLAEMIKVCRGLGARAPKRRTATHRTHQRHPPDPPVLHSRAR